MKEAAVLVLVVGVAATLSGGFSTALLSDGESSTGNMFGAATSFDNTAQQTETVETAENSSDTNSTNDSATEKNDTSNTSFPGPEPVFSYDFNSRSSHRVISRSGKGLSPDTGKEGKGFHSSGDGFVRIQHSSSFELSEGTLSLEYMPHEGEENWLLSKDADGCDPGCGHLSIAQKPGKPFDSMQQGELSVRMQDGNDTVLHAPEVTEDAWNQVTLSFGETGTALYLNGSEVDSSDTGFSLEENILPVYLSRAYNPQYGGSNSSIDSLRLYDRRLNASQIADRR